jgi:hypothetical protein
VLTIQPTGARGQSGATGAGVAAGGSANDILKKTSSTDYATEWETPTSAATSEAIVRRDETGGAFFGGDVGAPTYRGNFYQAESATDGASLRNSAGTAILTWGATAGNISITVNTTSTGHFFSNPSTAEAGHFLTKNGTTPTIAAGRSAWFSNASGAPQFKNGTSSAITLIYSGGPLGTPTSGTLTNCTGLPISPGVSGLSANMANFLADGNASNFQNAIAGQYTGTGFPVMENGPVITNININTAATFNATTYTYGTGAAAAHRTALGLTSLATASSGSGVITALAINIGSSGSVVVNGGALGQPTSGTLTNCSGLPISTGVSGLGTGVATLLTGTPSGTGGPVGTTSPTITTPTFTRSGNGTILTASEGTRSITFGAQSYGTEMVLTASTVGQGAYITANGMLESWVNVIANTNTTNLRVMRFGNKTNRFEIQRLNDASNSILGTPFSFANDAPTNAFYMLTSGTVGFGTSTPSEKSLLDLTSTTKGFLPPRMTTVQRDAITSVPAGLTIYNTTTNKLNFYNGSAWEAVTSA